jgi:propanol-preferring alcohol dehydrogenase
VTSAARAAYDAALPCVRPTGMLLVVGLPSESLCFPPILMAATEVRIQASSVGTREDLRKVLAMAAAGKLHCQVSARPLAQANDVLGELRAGSVAGRIVLTPR